LQCSDNDGGSSIEPKNIEEHGGGGRFISTKAQQQARKTEAGISVGDHNSKTSGGGLKKYNLLFIFVK